MKKFMKLCLMAICGYCLPVSAEIIPLADSVGNTGNYDNGGYTFSEPHLGDFYIIGKVRFTNFVTPNWNVVTLFNRNGDEVCAYAQLGNHANWGMITGGQPEFPLVDNPIVDGEEALLVLKLDATNKKFQLWFNPDLTQAETTPDAEQPSDRNLTMGRIAFRGGHFGNGNPSIIDYEDFSLYLNESPFNNHAPVTPTPAIGAQRVELTTDLSWNAPAYGTTSGYDVYISNQEPNLALPDLGMTKVASATTATTLSNAQLVAAYGSLTNDTTYFWRVDSYEPNLPYTPILRTGNTWNFTTKPATVLIESGPISTVVADGGDAHFTVNDLNGQDYEWYYTSIDGSVTDQLLTESAKYVNANTSTLTVADATMADEGYYYCKVSNSLPSELTSPSARLWIERMIAYWPFENGSFESVIAGSPAMITYGSPSFTTGIAGNAMEIKDSTDLIYTEPTESSYFDICNYSMTVACWVKTNNTQTWVPFVARNGEGQGWQLRQSGFSSDRICLTTRGTGNDDGTYSNRAVFDNQWHYLVGTFNGSEKRIYIDGVLSVRYSQDNGSVALEADAANAPINPTTAPVAIAARVHGDLTNPTIENGNNLHGIYDEVVIYNYALSAEDIAQYYANMTGQDVCLGQQYDINNDCVVDLADFGILASEWLEDAKVTPALN